MWLPQKLSSTQDSNKHEQNVKVAMSYEELAMDPDTARANMCHKSKIIKVNVTESMLFVLSNLYLLEQQLNLSISSF